MGPLLVAALEPFTKVYPNIKLRITFGTSEELLHLLESNGLDFLLSFQPEGINNDFDVEIAYQSGLPTKIVGYKCTIDKKRKVKIIWIHGFALWVKEFMKADIVVCISSWAKKQLMQVLPELKTTIVCHNLVNEGRILKLSSTEVVSNSKRGITLITVSRLSKEKGIARFINVLANVIREHRHLDITYFVVGDGPEKKSLQELIQHLKLENFVKLLGEKSNPYAYMKQADLYVCPSYSEGYSTTCVEASILGIPILTTDVPGAREIIQTAEAGMVVANNEQGLRSGLLTIIQDENRILLREWSKKLVHTAENFFCKARQKEVDDLYKEIELILLNKSDCSTKVSHK